MDISRIQSALAEEKIEAWLFYDFQGTDPIARRLLGIAEDAHLTRRWFYLIPRTGSPRKLVHKIEPGALDHLPGESLMYAGWQELERSLAVLLAGLDRVAMQYSPNNGIPYVSRVDAGTIEQIRAVGVTVITSADLVQRFEAVLSESQLQSHIRASKALRSIVDDTFGFVADRIGKAKKLTEYDVQQFIWERFAVLQLRSDSRPIVAVGPNAGNPHYTPTENKCLAVSENDFLLIDLWARERAQDAIFADITWTGFVGKEVPARYEEIFQIVAGARDAALAFVAEAVQKERPIQGGEADDVARNHIREKGYGDYFVHRTGHNIGVAVHGVGANLDNFETREQRKLMKGTCFSIEPGIYLKEFGVRSEIDVYIGDRDVAVYSEPIQTRVVPILR